jgi:tRNA-specific 2-thiouridylase
VCKQLDVSLQVIPLQQEYWDRVVSYTIAEVKAGRTPSPDLLCNQQVKFGAFFDALDDSFEKVATGHYAQVEEHDGLFYLKCAPDLVKDQTYFLSYLNQKQLARLLFPIGHLLKSDVRQLAKDFNLPTQDRKDSQGICFLGKIKFSDFVKHHLGIKKGSLIEIESGEKVGDHDGFWFFTIGQRQGLGLSGGPWYVVKKEAAKNIVYISRHYYADDKKRDEFEVRSCNWIVDTPQDGVCLRIKLRHGELFHQGTLTLADGNRGFVKLDERDQGISPGQFAVFYDNEICLGCGIIE